jgi:beta-lactamase regulating signal transducer with metallopeptidase domain
MNWQIPIENFVARALLSGLAISMVGVLVALAFRQPARKLRVLELTILGCLLAPLIPFFPGLPRWSILPETALRPIANLPAEQTLTIAEPVVEVPTPGPGPGPGPGPAIGAPVPALPARQIAPTISWNRVLIVIYLGVAGCLALRWMVGIVAVTRLIGTSRPASESLRERLVEVAGPAANRLRLRLSDRIEQPIAASVLRPTILIPERLSFEGDPVSIRCAIAHEWSHIERRDLLTWYLASLALIPFFPLPTFWWFRRRVRLCQDFLADARAASFAPSPEDYADFLIRYAGRFQPRAIGLGLGDRGLSLRRRVEMLTTPHEPLQQRCPRRQSVAIALAALGLILAVGSIRLQAADPPWLAQTVAKPAVEFTFAGIVIDSGTNQPFGGAEVVVRIIEAGQQSGGDPVASAKTDAEGRYRVTVPGISRDESFRTVLVIADHPKYASSTLRTAPAFLLNKQPAPNLPTFPEIKLKPAKPTSGLIVTPEGRPAPGVIVIASWAIRPPMDQFSLGNPPQTGRIVTKTNEQGRFAVKSPADLNVRFEFIPSGFVGESLATTQRGELEKITLKAGMRLKGVVLDSEGRPLASVGLRVSGQGVQNIRQTETDAEGKFAFDPLLPGPCTLQPTPSLIDYSTLKLIRSRPLPAAFRPSQIRLVLKDGEEPAPITIKAVPHVSIEVRCLDGAGKPIADQSVSVLSPSPPRLDGNGARPAPNPNLWASAGPTGPDGRVTIFAPKGTENALLAVLPNQWRAVRYEDNEGRPIPNSLDGIALKNLENDVKGVIVRVYRTPVVSLKLATRDGLVPKDLKFVARYDGEAPSTFAARDVPGIKGIRAQTDRIAIRGLSDGRLQISSIVPGSPVTITASAEGYRPAELKVTLAEGEAKDLELILDRP